MAHRATLSLADLVVLSMLTERPMHGYELWAELQRRHVWKWAEISRPQVYYSLKKLEAAEHVEAAGDADPSLGPERRTLVAHAAGTPRAVRCARPRRMGDATAAVAISHLDGALLAGATARFHRADRAPPEVSRRAARGRPRRAGCGDRRDVCKLRRGHDRAPGPAAVRDRARLARRRREAPTARLRCAHARSVENEDVSHICVF